MSVSDPNGSWYHSVDGELVPVNLDQKAAMEASGSNHSNHSNKGSNGDLK